MADPIKHVRLTPAERALRIQLQGLVHASGLMRATLTVRERACGRPSCRCAAGQKHASLYVVSRQDGKTRQLFVPKHLEGKARQWVKSYQEVLELLEKISERCWRRIEEREE
jgi:hypothetical protein